MVIKAVKELENDLVKFTQEIIKIPSLTGDEARLAEVVLDKLREIAVDDAFIDGIGNVIGLLHGQGNGPNILFNSHLDVVPVGCLENWHGYDPFGAAIDQERNIHGRGAADLKGGLSVQLYTLKLLKDLRDKGISIPGDVIFSAVVHEESAEMFGIDYLCKKTLPERSIKFDVVFLCEPSNLKVILGHRGKVEIVVRTRGRTAHSSTPSAGINALQKMLPVLDFVFNKMGRNLPIHPDLGQGSVTITNLICKPGALSIIPDECEISIDRRYVPGETLKSILEEFEDMFKEIKNTDPRFEGSVSVRTFSERSYTGYEKEVQKHHPVWITDKEHPFVKKVLKALRQVEQDPRIGYWQFGTDGSMTAGLMGVPTIGYSGMEECYAHTPEEMVSIGKMMQSLEGYFSICCELFEMRNHIRVPDLLPKNP